MQSPKSLVARLSQGAGVQGCLHYEGELPIARGLRGVARGRMTVFWWCKRVSCAGESISVRENMKGRDPSFSSAKSSTFSVSPKSVTVFFRTDIGTVPRNADSNGKWT